MAHSFNFFFLSFFANKMRGQNKTKQNSIGNAYPND